MMAYFKVNDNDLSMYVNKLNITKQAKYSSSTNAAGNTVADYINTKRVLKVGFIALNDAAVKSILTAIEGFSLSVSYREPTTGLLETINCIVPKHTIDYYTIQENNVMYNEFTITFNEL